MFVEGRADAETEFSVKKAAFKTIADGWPRAAHAFSFLMNRAKKSVDPQIRLAALEAVANGWLRSEQGFNFIKTRAVVDPDPNVRKSALVLMAGLRDGPDLIWSLHIRTWEEDIVSVLQERIRKDPDLGVRESIFELLRHHYLKGSASFKPQIYYCLQKLATDDSEPKIQTRALKWLSEVKP